MASVDSRGSELPTVANNSQIVEQLGEPASVWLYFSQLSQIPRRSGCEADVLRMLEEFATERQFECRRDAAGNTVISRPGSGTGREAPTVVIQNHVDMVCVKGDTSRHDFSMDPIRFVRDGGWGDDWLTADDTTLGSDNGIGVAIALSVLDLPQEASLPPIEALFTVDEETGLTGVQKLDPGLVTGRTLLNLDTEQWGEICVGSAGTGTTEILLPVHREAPAGDAVCMQLEVSGLLGGHSGAEIQCDRANAVKLAARAARRLLAAAPGSQLVDLAGGELRNSIPRRAAATLLVAGRDCSAALQAAADASRAAFLAEYGTVETALELSWREAEAPPAGGRPLCGDSASRLLSLLSCLPHGVHKYSHSIPGLPETSSNLAVVEACGGEAYRVTTTTRSSVPDALESVRDAIEATATLCGGRAERRPAYSGWQPDLASGLLARTRAAYAEALGREPRIKASHAGLECGVLSGLLPGLDAVSIGPEIRGAHSVDERVQVSTVAECHRLVLRLLEGLTERRPAQGDARG
uniref:Aminoacylhistidine dipeptidase n=1 Tax=Tetraselmis sp. GSL018 TaxID=582737 RepID=A0A061RSB6_9CHLO